MKEETVIIGGGIVGATAAYYLSRQGYPVTIFDDGIGQATSASAGIICPWFSLRRNKPWYFLVSQGAEFYRRFMLDLQEDGFDTDYIFNECGAIFIRRNQKRINQDLKMASEKITASPSIKSVKPILPEEVNRLIPFIHSDYPGLYVEGGGRVDGQALIACLYQAIQDLGGKIIQESAHLEEYEQGNIHIKSSSHQLFAEHILLAPGPNLPNLLEPLGYQVDIHPQKGQLFTVNLSKTNTDQNWPVLIPFGMGDIIPMSDGTVTIGATHEDDKGFDLSVDWKSLSDLQEEASLWMPPLPSLPIESTRVGTRAHTSDFSVLVGEIPGLNHITAISGLGSSGLTSGPYLGYQFAQKVLTHQWTINPKDFPINNYIQKHE